MTHLVTYNLNGIRSALRKGFAEWLEAVSPDIVCIQEMKATKGQFSAAPFEKAGYHHFWFPAKRKGYSGVGILSRIRPNHVQYGFENDEKGYNNEGRVIRADFDDFSVFSIYVPNGSSGDERLAYKMEWLENFTRYILEFQKEQPHIIISGDFNICHHEIDIFDPVRNAKNSGFLPQERAWLTDFSERCKLTDSFRHFEKGAGHYTWWSYRSGARAANKGWRIDYHFVSQEMTKRLQSAEIHPDVVHSDHCPASLRIR